MPAQTPRPPRRIEPEALPPGVPARLAAVKLLERVLGYGRTFEDALGEVPLLAQLEGADAGFARAMALAALRRHGAAQDIIGQLLNKPLPARAAALAGVIEIGIAQLLFLDVPPHAAVDATVETARVMGLNAYCGLANAVLKAIARDLPAWKSEADKAWDTALPPWLFARLQQHYSREALAAIIGAQAGYGSRHAPVIDLSLLHKDAAVPEGAELLPNGSRRVHESGRIEIWPGFMTGEWWVQDMAATLPGLMLADAVSAPARVLDACAAPGGKTMQLLAAGYTVTALDRSGPRLRRLRENLGRLNRTAEIIEADATTYAPTERFDAVLLDAPCSATGTIRRHPELAWQRSPEEIARMVGLQKNMLRQAARWVKPGGILVYAVCSLLPEEGEAQIAALLAEDAALLAEDAAWQPATANAATLGFPEAIATPEGGLRTLPSHLAEQGGMDGFYVARLRRIESF